MRWLKFSLGVVLVLGAVFVGGGLLLPDEVVVERSIRIERPPQDVFAVIDGFGRFNEWSPWVAHDPTAQYAFHGPATGVGARMTWSGEKGGGAQEIVALTPNEQVTVDLDFGSEGKALSQHLLSADGDATDVRWRFEIDFDGDLVGRWFGLMFEGMIGPDYEKGLANLKRVVEAGPPAAAPAAANEPTAIDAPAEPADGEAASDPEGDPGSAG